MSSLVVGSGKFAMVETLQGSQVMPSFETQTPSSFTFFFNSANLPKLMQKPADSRAPRTLSNSLTRRLGSL